jgi:hypothetical protein
MVLFCWFSFFGSPFKWAFFYLFIFIFFD